MRTTAALFLFLLAAWRGYIDWQISAAQGADLTLTPTLTVWERISPGTYNAYLPRLQSAEVPYLWEPFLQTVLSWPMALLLLGLSAFFFLIRRRPERGQAAH